MIIDGMTARQPLLASAGPGSSMPHADASDLRADAGPHVAVESAARPGQAIAFGPFHLIPARRLLLRAASPVRLGSRALEILIALVERPGELVSKSELMARVWPDTFVEESNLKVQMAGLRRALGDDGDASRFVATMPGRGYRFVHPIARTDEESVAPRPGPAMASRLPAPITRLIDRTDSLETLLRQLANQRLVTVVGPGGIGKTTLALAVARQLAGSCEHGARFVDLARLAERGGQLPHVEALLGPDAALGASGTLIVLDNCEHVIEAAAALTAELLDRVPDVRILATSREPLRTAGEHVHHLSPLACPPASMRVTAAEALRFPAVELFVERAAAAMDGFTFGDQDAALVADICRRLDGVPLAIELAAARVDVFGLHGLAMRLREPSQLLAGGRRAALPRQRTLRAALEWSHDLLSEAERKVLRRLAVFPGGFTLEAASAVAACDEIMAGEVVEHVADLVTKSLLVADVGGVAPRYRLLGTTRAYALEKLHESDDAEDVARRHAACRALASEPSETGRAGGLLAARTSACGRRIGVTGPSPDRIGPRQGAPAAALPF